MHVSVVAEREPTRREHNQMFAVSNQPMTLCVCVCMCVCVCVCVTVSVCVCGWVCT